MATETVAAPSEPVAANGRGAAVRRRRSRLRYVLVAAAVAIVVALFASVMASSRPAAPVAPVAPQKPVYDARGRVVPVSQARVATIGGGVLRALPRRPGDRVQARDELARVEAMGGSTEVLSAPFGGTVLAVPAQVGDTLLPGSPVVVIGDLTELRIETTDVDEYLIASIRQGQAVEIAIDALGDRTLMGRVETVSLLAQAGVGSRLHYPITIVLSQSDASLRPSMTARLRFEGIDR